MVSLNDLDEQIGALEESTEEESAEASGPATVSPPKERPVAEHAPPKKEPKKAPKKAPKAKSAEDPGTAAGDEAPTKKRRKDKASRNAVCFRYFEGTCRFEDCKFLHVSPQKLTDEERAQVLHELPLRKFSQKLADVIAGLNIPRCKDFHQRGGCKRPPGRCHFWHLTDASAARWAGFNFWCEAVELPVQAFTSQDQMLEQGMSSQSLTANGPAFHSWGGWGSKAQVLREAVEAVEVAQSAAAVAGVAALAVAVAAVASAWNPGKISVCRFCTVFSLCGHRRRDGVRLAGDQGERSEFCSEKEETQAAQ
ncbi:yop-1 [Symbiodinium natans]|uniref:Yop-1 protein n=1 Tax=Symbiodinium natans TaxID=878477 RepID=A0A812RA11_9DINO|nr:yop-1 [Symbiodinium natans]